MRPREDDKMVCFEELKSNKKRTRLPKELGKDPTARLKTGMAMPRFPCLLLFFPTCPCWPSLLLRVVFTVVNTREKQVKEDRFVLTVLEAFLYIVRWFCCLWSCKEADTCNGVIGQS